MSAGTVLLIDDDQAFRFALRKALRRSQYDVLEASSGDEALSVLAGPTPPEVALLDLRMKGMDGLEVLRRRGGGTTQILVLTGHGTVQAAVEAMRLGAYSFLEKPVDAEVLKPLLKQAVRESKRVQDSDGDGSALAPPLIGESEAMDEVRRFIETVGPTDETVTVYGETGTGKEVVARHIHLASPRGSGPFVAMNAACVPRDLFESELFGHKRGAFTGATSDRLGLFREADGGTLFIDELAELPVDSQAKLLRALETRMVRPVGEGREYPVDVRIVAATNGDLWNAVQAGGFREDLYFRLQVFPVLLPPLRDRPDDVAPLSAHLLDRLGHGSLVIPPESMRALEAYHWPGNVRELLNVLRRAALFASDQEIPPELLRRMITASVFGHAAGGTRPSPKPNLTGGQTTPSAGAALAGAGQGASEEPARTSLADVERAHIENVLNSMDGNVTKAATALGIDRRTLQRKLKAYGMSQDG